MQNSLNLPDGKNKQTKKNPQQYLHHQKYICDQIYFHWTLK